MGQKWPMDASLRRGRVVLVDDDPALLQALSFAFETEGYIVTALTSGEALLNLPEQSERTCIIIDERLPGISGLDTMVRLRAQGVSAPAILVTSNPAHTLRRRAAKAGVDIIEKPLMGDALAAKVREAFALSLADS